MDSSHDDVVSQASVPPDTIKEVVEDGALLAVPELEASTLYTFLLAAEVLTAREGQTSCRQRSGPSSGCPWRPSV